MKAKYLREAAETQLELCLPHQRTLFHLLSDLYRGLSFECSWSDRGSRRHVAM